MRYPIEKRHDLLTGRHTSCWSATLSPPIVPGPVRTSGHVSSVLALEHTYAEHLTREIALSPQSAASSPRGWVFSKEGCLRSGRCVRDGAIAAATAQGSPAGDQARDGYGVHFFPFVSQRSSWFANACRSLAVKFDGPPVIWPPPRSSSNRLRTASRSPTFASVYSSPRGSRA